MPFGAAMIEQLVTIMGIKIPESDTSYGTRLQLNNSIAVTIEAMIQYNTVKRFHQDLNDAHGNNTF